MFNYLTSLLNRIYRDKLPNNFFVEGLPILLGTIRGGHTSAQNWINISILDYLDIDYKINPKFFNIVLKNKRGSKPLEPCDLRSLFLRKNPLWGYITNDPGFSLNLLDRDIFIFIRSPKSTFKSIYILSKYNFGFNDRKANKFTYAYMKSWSKRLKKLIENKKKNNNRIYFFKAENLFENPYMYVQKILSLSGIYIPYDDILQSITKYDEKCQIFKEKIDINNPRNSYKNRYIKLTKEEESFIESLFLYEFYSEEEQFYLK